MRKRKIDIDKVVSDAFLLGDEPSNQLPDDPVEFRSAYSRALSWYQASLSYEEKKAAFIGLFLGSGFPEKDVMLLEHLEPWKFDTWGSLATMMVKEFNIPDNHVDKLTNKYNDLLAEAKAMKIDTEAVRVVESTPRVELSEISRALIEEVETQIEDLLSGESSTFDFSLQEITKECGGKRKDAVEVVEHFDQISRELDNSAWDDELAEAYSHVSDRNKRKMAGLFLAMRRDLAKPWGQRRRKR